MGNKDYLKFFCGFFFSGILILILMLLLKVLPFSINGFVFDYSIWTMGMLLSCFFVIACAYLGWEKKQANRISVSILLFLSGIVFINGSYFIGDGYVFDNSYASVKNVINYKEEVVLEDNISNDSISLALSTYAYSISSERDDVAQSIALDEEGNIYIAGHFSGTIDLDQKGFMRTSLGGVGDTNDIYLVKYSPTKEFVWGFIMGSVGNDMVSVLKVKNDYIYLGGSMGGKLDFDPSEKEYVLDAGIGQDGFVAKYSLNGDFLWANKIGNPEIIPFTKDDIRFEGVSALSIDDNGNVFTGAYFDGIIEFEDINANKYVFTNVDYKKVRDIIVVKYNERGEYVNATTITGRGVKEPKDLICDELGNVYLVGFFNNSIASGIDSKKELFTLGGQDIVMVQYDNDLNLLWAKRWGSAGNDMPGAVVLNKSGNILMTGRIGAYINFDGFKLGVVGGQDVFWLEIDKEGKILQANSFGGRGFDGSNAIAIDSLDNVYIGGYFNGVIDFSGKIKGNNSIKYPISSGEATDGFLAKYDKAGKLLWVNTFGGDVSLKDEVQEVKAIVVDKLDYPIITGKYYKEVLLNTSLDLGLISKGMSDGLIIKYDPEGGIK